MPFIMLVVAAILVAADQLIKHFVVVNYVADVAAIPNFLTFTYLQNEGMAFGLLDGQRWFFIITTSLLIMLLIAALFVYKKHNWITYTTCALIIGGGIGNLIDRVLNGYVVDYIKISFFDPVFNLADCCVVVGTLLFLVYILVFLEKDSKHEPQDEEAEISGEEASVEGPLAEETAGERVAVGQGQPKQDAEIPGE